MKKIAILISFLLFGVFHACKENTSHTVDTMVWLTEKEARQTLFTYGMTPDSLSLEQKEVMRKLEIITYEHCAVKNKRLEVTVSKKEFKAMGVPEIYYDILKKDIEDINHYLDTTTSAIFVADSVMAAFKKSQDEYFAKKVNGSRQ
ncbi:MAG: hypothetical protein LBQ22_00415 [Bacteroidales bacterium]|jgi:hypothetical protein|nr:hypothetical protein [Bacteroidales bacterium]